MTLVLAFVSPGPRLLSREHCREAAVGVRADGPKGAPAPLTEPRVAQRPSAKLTREGLVQGFRVAALAWLLGCAGEPVVEPPPEPPPPSPTPALEDDVRERIPVVVGGQPESWALRWTGPRTIGCWGDTSCPCEGFETAELGPAVLVRERDGVELDRLDLAPLFPGGGVMIPRATRQEGDDTIAPADRAAALAARPALPVLTPRDYDHDGQDAEALLQVEAGPCGHTASALIGLGPDGRLQARRTPERPDAPLVLETRAWASLLDGTGESTVIACGDHGAEEEHTVRLWAAGGQIHGERRIYTCTPAGGRGEAHPEEPL